MTGLSSFSAACPAWRRRGSTLLIAVALLSLVPPAAVAYPVSGVAADPDGLSGRGAGAWSAPVVVAEAPRLYSPMVAAAPEGDVTIVWTRADQREVRRGVFSRTRQAGGSWGPVLRLSRSGWLEDVGVDQTGKVTAAWTRSIPGQREVVLAATRPDAGAWTSPRRISRVPRSRGTFTRTHDVELAVSPGGAVAAVWTLGSEHGGPDYRPVANYRPAGGHWGTPVRLADPSPFASYNKDLEIRADGVPLVLMETLSGVSAMQRIDGRWRPVGGRLTRAQDGEVSLAIGPSGHTVAVARFNNAGRSVVKASRLVQGRWTTPRLLTRDDAYSRQVGVDARGDATFIWYEPAGDAARVTRWPADGTPGRLHTFERRSSGSVGLAVSRNGVATAVWEDSRRGGEQSLLASTRPQGGAWSEPRLISGRVGELGDGSTGIDAWPAGRAVTTWTGPGDRRALVSFHR